MRILHLTDLHLTEVRVTLDDLWAGAERALRGQRPFDFVVISGDLTQSAKPEEYVSVLAFLAHEIANDLVRDGDRRRVVVVPGNHDVDRSCAEIWDASFKPGPDDARRAMRDPEGSSFRRPPSGERSAPPPWSPSSNSGRARSRGACRCIQGRSSRDRPRRIDSAGHGRTLRRRGVQAPSSKAFGARSRRRNARSSALRA